MESTSDESGRTDDDVETVLRLLSTGDVPEAKTALTAAFENEPEPPDIALGAPRRACYLLHWLLNRPMEPVNGQPWPLPSEDAATGAEAHDHGSIIRTLECAIAAGVALRAGRTHDLLDSTGRALDALPPNRPWITFYVGSLLQATYRFTGREDARTTALEVCGRVADRTDLPHLAVQARGLMGNIHMMRGALHRAIALCDGALELADATGLSDSPAAAMAWQFRGYVLFEWNRLDEAAESLERAWHLAGMSRGVGTGVARMMARLSAARDRADQADLWMDRLEGLMVGPVSLRNREWLTSVRVGHTLGAGALRHVEAWMKEYDYRPDTIETMPDDHILARLHEFDHVLALLEATRQWTDILRLAPVIERLTESDRRWFAVRAATTTAVALEAVGRPDEADVVFDRALVLGAEGGMVRAFVEGSTLRGRLLDRSGSGGQGGEARRVLGATSGSHRRGRTRLTPAQRTVLGRLAAGESNKAIAEHIGVTVSTVKTHLRAIYAELEVRSRTHAVARARAAGLVDD